MDSHSNGETQAIPLMLADNQVITLVGCIILSAWPASFGVKMVGYFLLWLNNSGGPILIVSGDTSTSLPAVYKQVLCL